ncbi:bZIP transcription factor 60 [Ricinus communis]|uniref:bZIP transcription factor 60 n=1 Tax=Ricinus communis TaxID=3988 RepID=UPI00201AF011|nr:bZIP transcription factor 60 [Ricinus communis]
MEDTDDILESVNFDSLGQIDWDNLFDDNSPLLVTESSSSPENFSDSSPDSVSLWIDQVENMLMKDDDVLASAQPSQHFSEGFLADLLVDSPADGSVDLSTDKDSIVSPDNGFGGASETEKEGEKILSNNEAKVDNDSEDPDDPVSKKRRRQLRNRDAAVRSRERKKIYVRDLEIKSRYLEGECRRLGRLLQCFVAENQALRLGLQKGNAFGVTLAKQESAVLLLESLLLGSLLWFLGIMCLFTLSAMSQLTLVAVPLENVGKKVPERGAGSKMFTSLANQSFVNSRKCKASRTRMKAESVFIGVLV